MIRVFKKLLWAIVVIAWAVVFAPAFAQVVRLDVTINPSTIKVNEFADVTIKAVDASGEVVTTYGQHNDGDIMMYIEEYGNRQEHPDFVLPGNGFYFFEASDQWVRVFSKGLTLLTPGVYTLKVTELFNTSIRWEAVITVTATGTVAPESNVQVDAPVDGTTITSDVLNVVGTTELPNTPVAFYINDEKVQDSISDQNTNFNVFISGVEPGEHILEVRAMDLAGSDVGSSWPIGFVFDPPEDATQDLLVDVEIIPSNEVTVGTIVTFVITTDPSVTAASVVLADGSSMPAQQESAWRFVRQANMSTIGVFPVHVTLTAPQVTREYRNVETVTVTDAVRRVLTLTPSVPVETNRNRIDLSWTYTWHIEHFRVMYGISSSDLSQMITTRAPQASLTRQDETQAWYLQVWPVDENNDIIGDPSPVSMVAGLAPLEEEEELETTAAPDPIVPQLQACETANIVLRTTQAGDRYFLTWDAVPGATSYIIYRAEQPPTWVRQMQRVGETAQTMYEYLFDPHAEADRYAWYAVEARCEDGSREIVDDIKMVQVGPMDTLLVILIAAWLLFGLSRLSLRDSTEV